MARRRIEVSGVKEILVQWDAGAEISAIARALDYSRPTVRKYVRAAEAVGLVRGAERRREADWAELAREAIARVANVRTPGEASQEVARFHATIERQLGEVRLSVLHQRLCDEHGLGASWGTFYRYVRQHWPEQMARVPRVTSRRDDPPPGEEAQIDFGRLGEWFDPEGGRKRRVYGFFMTLSHSRHQFLYPVLSEDQEAWLDGHVEAFAFFNGAPRRLVPDNLTSAITKADRYDPRVNRAYAELVRYYGCIVDPSRVRRPTDKARVERNVSYGRESFFRGREFPSLQAMREEARRWSLDVAGRRVHGTTRERPYEAFLAREQPALLALPERRWEPVTWTAAKVHPDCHLQTMGARYSVPYRYVGRRLEVRLGRDLVEIYDGPELITSHLRRPHGRATRMDHYPDAHQAFLRATPQACLRRAQALGSAAGEVVGALLESHALHHLREVQAILRLVDEHGPEAVERACRQALEAGDGRYRTVRGLLERGLVEPPVDERSPVLARAFLRGPEAFTVAGGAR